MPFSSARQMRFMFSKHPRTARKMADRMKRKGMKFPKGKSGKKRR